ncbi:MAG: molybdopterin molybdenumtransferase MoeA, partial [Methylophilales bacterium 16-45-9]
MTTPTLSQLIANPSCMDDYDPNSMPVAKARQFIKQFLEPLAETEQVGLCASLGRILAQDILSPANVPNYDNSAMDGYALRAADLHAEQLTVIGSAFAGKPYHGAVASGECVRIMTGATIPSGCDSVVMQEQVSAEGDSITFNAACKRGQNIRLVGEDIQQGAVVLAQGQRINPA